MIRFSFRNRLEIGPWLNLVLEICLNNLAVWLQVHINVIKHINDKD